MKRAYTLQKADRLMTKWFDGPAEAQAHAERCGWTVLLEHATERPCRICGKTFTTNGRETAAAWVERTSCSIYCLRKGLKQNTFLIGPREYNPFPYLARD